MQDIVPRKSIQEIKKEGSRSAPQTTPTQATPSTKKATYVPPVDTPYVTTPYTRPDTRRQRSTLGRNIFLVGGFLILATFLLLTFVFPQAVISIKPLTQVVETKQNELVIAPGAYTIDSIVKKGDQKVQTSGTRPVSRKATGVVIIYNAFSTSPQVLVANTRLATKDGRVYRISKQVSIPGYTQKDGKTTPGSIAVGIVADQAGDTYNEAALDLSVVAYAGTTKGTQIYARTKSAISGGALGTEPIINQADVTKAVNDLNSSLLSDLQKQLNALVKTNYFSTKDLVLISSSTVVTGDTVSVSVTGAKVFVSENALAAQLAKITNDPKLLTNTLEFQNNTMSLTLPNQTLPDQSASLTILATGSAVISTKVDNLLIKEKLTNVSKADFFSVMQLFPQLKEASFTVRPFWLQSFPDTQHIIIQKE